MISYELAKQLNDASFPFTACGVLNSYSGDIPVCSLCGQKGFLFHGKHYAFPTLSELIEACGNGFRELKRAIMVNTKKPVFRAVDNKNLSTYPFPTPEEAVANLWLELNKKS